MNFLKETLSLGQKSFLEKETVPMEWLIIGKS